MKWLFEQAASLLWGYTEEMKRRMPGTKGFSEPLEHHTIDAKGLWFWAVDKDTDIETKFLLVTNLHEGTMYLSNGFNRIGYVFDLRTQRSEKVTNFGE